MKERDQQRVKRLNAEGAAKSNWTVPARWFAIQTGRGLNGSMCMLKCYHTGGLCNYSFTKFLFVPSFKSRELRNQHKYEHNQRMFCLINKSRPFFLFFTFAFIFQVNVSSHLLLFTIYIYQLLAALYSIIPIGRDSTAWTKPVNSIPRNTVYNILDYEKQCFSHYHVTVQQSRSDQLQTVKS